MVTIHVVKSGDTLYGHHKFFSHRSRHRSCPYHSIEPGPFRQNSGKSYWVLGYPFPENWTLLEENFIIRKV